MVDAAPAGGEVWEACGSRLCGGGLARSGRSTMTRGGRAVAGLAPWPGWRRDRLGAGRSVRVGAYAGVPAAAGALFGQGGDQGGRPWRSLDRGGDAGGGGLVSRGHQLVVVGRQVGADCVHERAQMLGAVAVDRVLLIGGEIGARAVDDVVDVVAVAGVVTVPAARGGWGCEDERADPHSFPASGAAHPGPPGVRVDLQCGDAAIHLAVLAELGHVPDHPVDDKTTAGDPQSRTSWSAPRLVRAVSSCDEDGDVVLGGRGSDHLPHDLGTDRLGWLCGHRCAQLVDVVVDDEAAAFDQPVGVQAEDRARRGNGTSPLCRGCPFATPTGRSGRICTVVAARWGAARMAGGCPAEDSRSAPVAGVSIPHSTVAIMSGWKWVTWSSRRVNTSAGSSLCNALARSTARNWLIDCAAARPCPTTSPTTRQTVPEGRQNTSYQSPPTSPAPPAT